MEKNFDWGYVEAKDVRRYLGKISLFRLGGSPFLRIETVNEGIVKLVPLEQVREITIMSEAQCREAGGGQSLKGKSPSAQWIDEARCAYSDVIPERPFFNSPYDPPDLSPTVPDDPGDEPDPESDEEMPF